MVNPSPLTAPLKDTEDSINLAVVHLILCIYLCDEILKTCTGLLIHLKTYLTIFAAFLYTYNEIILLKILKCRHVLKLYIF